MLVYLCGQKYFGQAVYGLLRELGYVVVGVSSPAYRNERLKAAEGGANDLPDRLRRAAQGDGVPWLEAGRLRAEMLPAKLDLIVAAHSHDFLGRRTRLRARLGALGYHPSLLPLHRGRDAIRWVVKQRERVTGGTVFWLDDTVDGGPVAAQDYCFVRPDDDAETLWRRDLQPMGLRLLAQVLREAARGVLVAVPQDPSLATWEPALNQPPLYRPELPLIGGVDGARFVASAEEARAMRGG